MLFISLRLLKTLFFDLIYIIGLTKNDKELEIFILRQQLRISQRKITKTPRISDPERILLSTLTEKFLHSSELARQRHHQVMLIFRPDTVLRWHRLLVRCKWTFRRKGNPGRPKIPPELEALIVRWRKRINAGAMKRYKANYSKSVTGLVFHLFEIPSSDMASRLYRSGRQARGAPFLVITRIRF